LSRKKLCYLFSVFFFVQVSTIVCNFEMLIVNQCEDLGLLYVPYALVK